MARLAAAGRGAVRPMKWFDTLGLTILTTTVVFFIAWACVS